MTANVRFFYHVMTFLTNKLRNLYFFYTICLLASIAQKWRRVKLYYACLVQNNTWWLYYIGNKLPHLIKAVTKFTWLLSTFDFNSLQKSVYYLCLSQTHSPSYSFCVSVSEIVKVFDTRERGRTPNSNCLPWQFPEQTSCKRTKSSAQQAEIFLRSIYLKTGKDA